MRILITTAQVPFVDGGAEALSRSLKEALIKNGHQAEIVSIPFRWNPPQRIHEHLLACRLLDLQECNGLKIDRVIGLKFPAYHIRHPNKVTWIIHQFRTAFEMWGTTHCDLSPNPEGKAIRDSIETIEKSLLPEAKALYTISETVTKRLKKFVGLESKPIYQPPENEHLFHQGDFGDYLYYPSRLNQWKRQHLLLEALAKTKKPVHLRLSGTPDHPEYLDELQKLAKSLGISRRVRFLGRLSTKDMVEQYANCCAVLFPAEQEDYGYVTLEAMLSGKPVITCADSGGPLEFISDQQEGLVVDPTPENLAEAMDHVWQFRSFAQACGKRSLERYRQLGITWDNVVKVLLQ